MRRSTRTLLLRLFAIAAPNFQLRVGADRRRRLDRERTRHTVPASDDPPFERNARRRRTTGDERGHSILGTARGDRERRGTSRLIGLPPHHLELVGERAEVLVDPGRELAEEGEELTADADAEEARVAVGGVERERNFVPSDVGVDRAARGPEHRADEVPGAGWQHGETARAGAAEKPEEHRLGAILEVMCSRDRAAARARRRGSERFIAGGSRARLEVPSRGDMDHRPLERDSQPVREFRHEVQFGRRTGANSVIHSVRRDGSPELRTEGREDVEEGHRIRPSAHGDENAVPAREEPLVANRARHEGEQCRGMGAGHEL
jgi:hypothetical protein